jgi:hypothetical protein
VRDRLRPPSRSPAGGALTVVLVVAVLVLAIGPRYDHRAAIVVIAVVAVLLAVSLARRGAGR